MVLLWFLSFSSSCSLLPWRAARHEGRRAQAVVQRGVLWSQSHTQHRDTGTRHVAELVRLLLLLLLLLHQQQQLQ